MKKLALALAAVLGVGTLFAAAPAVARDRDHGRFHDELEHRDYHRHLYHRDAHRYPMSPWQHYRLHDNLEHDAFHDRLEHRSYHRYRYGYAPYGRQYGYGVGGPGFYFWFGR